MENGDLANGFIPRYLFLWEYFSAYLPKESQVHERVLIKFGRWDSAVHQWELAPFLSERVWDLWQRFNMRCDMVVTTRPQSFADKVQELLDSEDIPIHTTLAMEPHVLARQMTHRRDVAQIVFSDPKLMMTFGHKGLYVPGGVAKFNPPMI